MSAAPRKCGSICRWSLQQGRDKVVSLHSWQNYPHTLWRGCGWVPVLCCWQENSLHSLCQGSLFTLRLLWPRWTLQVSACSVCVLRCPLLALLSALELLNCPGARLGTLMVSTPLLIWMEMWTAYVPLEALLYIFGHVFYSRYIFTSVESQLRPRALEKKYMNVLILQFVLS